MNRIFYLLLLLPFLGCKKDDQYSDQTRLVEIRSPNGINQSFEYSGDRLTKVNHYFICTTPVDEYSYVYDGNKLVKVDAVMRGMYSSTAALCNPASGIRSTEEFVYDGNGRLVRTNRSNSYTEYTYNSNGQIERETLRSSTGTVSTVLNYTYDSRGNIIEATDVLGGTIKYEYDNKINPFYQMKQRPSFISAFTTSPNNVIKGTVAASSWTRNIIQYKNDLPAKIEENGIIYEYIYR